MDVLQLNKQSLLRIPDEVEHCWRIHVLVGRQQWRDRDRFVLEHERWKEGPFRYCLGLELNWHSELRPSLEWRGNPTCFARGHVEVVLQEGLVRFRQTLILDDDVPIAVAVASQLLVGRHGIV